MIVNAIDGERINIAARWTKHDESAVLRGHSTLDPKNLRERDFGHSATADGGDAGAAEMVKRDTLAIGTDDFLDR